MIFNISHFQLEVSKGNDDIKIVLTKPSSFDGDADADYKAPNFARRFLSLFRNVRPGSDLTNFQLPPQFNIPKSQLQFVGESAYLFGKDLLYQCNNAGSPLERFISVVAWSISTTRAPAFGVAPYNPVLGETHHVSRGSLNVLLEQVSYQPPVAALHATDNKENIEFIWCQHPVPKFHGTRVEAEETGLEAELCYITSSIFGSRGLHSVKGKIYQSSSMKTLYEVEGHWNSTVKVKDINNGEETIIYDAKEVFSELKTPVVENLQRIWPTESAAVWNEVSSSILSKNWSKARDEKSSVEDNQRKLAKERNSKGETWVPKLFTVSYSKEDDWECSPIQERVPASPHCCPHLVFFDFWKSRSSW
ncbi:OSBP(OXYSTEROL-BINDING PROTEIN)-RELATED PROTEIN 4C [Salix koriyanagi]|uniref:OSBP(OXYSTEROL-BINDING PROTEIN)-RELATED PROTEIN 4C n=1 Tax=Salix koriyanagi TaxID=2511006 RepID=A0A9Q0VGL6_9ROSI|nr:OSBP(OXYSTEROL-BINDING PROTEIN)-RELATED PROTEIN 4C [Salix koriyanagi]